MILKYVKFLLLLVVVQGCENGCEYYSGSGDTKSYYCTQTDPYSCAYGEGSNFDSLKSCDDLGYSLSTNSTDTFTYNSSKEKSPNGFYSGESSGGFWGDWGDFWGTSSDTSSTSSGGTTVVDKDAYFGDTVTYAYNCGYGSESIQVPNSNCLSYSKTYAKVFACNDTKNMYSSCINMYSCLKSNSTGKYNTYYQQYYDSCSMYLGY